jgi:hypothetical protein
VASVPEQNGRFNVNIDVYYNEFTNWETEIKVRHPECEHEDYEETIKPNGDPLQGVFCCTVCNAVGVTEPPDEDGEIFIDWEHER